ncbi:MAG: glycosyltransferase family 9 protein [Bacteroidales bacterium]
MTYYGSIALQYDFMKKVLIIQTASIGDVILVTPVLEALHQNRPDARIDLLVKNGMEQLFNRHPFVHNVLVWQKAKGKYKSLHRLIHQVRSEKYDVVINVQRFMSSGLITVLSGAGTTIGFGKNPLSKLFTHRVEHKIGDPSVHEVDRNCALLKPLGIDPTPIIKLYPAQQDYGAIQAYQVKAYICLAPASLWFTKQFPREKWVELLDNLPHHYRCYLLGSQADTDFLKRISNKTMHPDVISLAGQLTLLQTAALMSAAVMNYCNDSAPLHLASAVNAPVTAIFCSTIPAFGFGPRSDKSWIAETEENLACRPCGIHGLKSCPEGHFRCGTSININQLIINLPK